MARERLGIFLIVIFAIISIGAIIARTIPGGEGEPGLLGIVPSGKPTLPCTGELSVTSKSLGNGRCELKADVTMRNCEGKRWYVFEGSECGGILVCNGDINEPVSNWFCSWQVTSGSHGFTLCADVDAKAYSSVTC